VGKLKVNGGGAVRLHVFGAEFHETYWTDSEFEMWKQAQHDDLISVLSPFPFFLWRKVG
jgi:hypothetical protein